MRISKPSKHDHHALWEHLIDFDPDPDPDPDPDFDFGIFHNEAKVVYTFDEQSSWKSYQLSVISKWLKTDN